eukprot:CAMPEP_0113586692 /NCGR_PEP_ID=MMETSP0015_2-20120614/34440_1 /TAXON_ID=2838 /ORGANISM="Odontella" /LENGTH=222 /DNA_ID=CAMNT_0000492161 /DNA_START=48 /DNA_END=712 /DNA_ORIENTATION=+ /assembly_acc=CAM_ASM_000160
MSRTTLPFVLVGLIAAFAAQCSSALSFAPDLEGRTSSASKSRADFLRSIAVGAVGGAVSLASAPTAASAAADVAGLKPKLTNLSDGELKKIIAADMIERSFLVSADLTREIYDERSVFTDEIDSYPIDKWVKGTQKLFVAEGSRVDLVGDVNVSPTKVEFRFDEDLMFRIPFRPVVSLSGSVVLDRDAESGLITGYREIWDQDVNAVLKTAKMKAADGSMKP